MRLIAIDPGNMLSGYVIISTENSEKHIKFKLEDYGNIKNFKLLTLLKNRCKFFDLCLIEMITSYGYAVGDTIFHTCRWIGKFELMSTQNSVNTALYTRPQVLRHHFGRIPKSADSKVREELIKKYPKESEGVTSHSWQALALGTMYLEASNAI